MPAYTPKILLLIFFLVFCSFSPALAAPSQGTQSLSEYHFSIPSGLESKVEFWKKVYSKYTTNHAIVHDVDNLDIVYEVVSLKNRSKLSRRARDR